MLVHYRIASNHLGTSTTEHLIYTLKDAPIHLGGWVGRRYRQGRRIGTPPKGGGFT